jgi:hypothetical protein
MLIFVCLRQVRDILITKEGSEDSGLIQSVLYDEV